MTPLPRSRPYEPESDYHRLRALLLDTYRQAGPPVQCTVGDLDWWLALEPTRRGPSVIQVWEAGSRLVGMARLNGSEVDFVVHPEAAGLEHEMLDWAEGEVEERARRRSLAASQAIGAAEVAAAQEPPSLVTWAYDANMARQRILIGRGYRLTGDYFNLHSGSLGAAGGPASPAAGTLVSPPGLPPGYSIRCLAGEEDLAPRVEVHRAAFAPSTMNVEKHRKAMSGATYRRDLDLVVVAPDGAFAAFCLAWFDPANRTGLFEPVGCHPAHRRRGLGTAVLREGMRRLADLGASVVYVASRPDGRGGTELYESLGMLVAYRNLAWKKVLVGQEAHPAHEALW